MNTGISRCLVSILFGVLCCEVVYAKAHIVIVGGLGGNTEYEESITETISAIEGSIAPGNRWVDTDAEFIFLSGNDVSADRVLTEMQTVSENAHPEDQFVLMLIGHGSYDGEHYRFNIPGPDLTDVDLKRAIDAIGARQQLVVLATSASGVMLQQLEKPDRIVITATKSGGEINAVVFPEFWADALSTDKADYDRNEIVTVTEAFRFANNAVETYYKDRNLLASEHARLLGTGADQQPIALIGSLRNVGDNPKVAQLLTQRAELEQLYHALLEKKDDSKLNDYYDELQALMVRFARLQVEIDRETGWSESSE